MTIRDLAKAVFGLLLVGAMFIVGSEVSRWAASMVKEPVT